MTKRSLAPHRLLTRAALIVTKRFRGSDARLDPSLIPRPALRAGGCSTGRTRGRVRRYTGRSRSAPRAARPRKINRRVYGPDLRLAALLGLREGHVVNVRRRWRCLAQGAAQQALGNRCQSTRGPGRRSASASEGLPSSRGFGCRGPVLSPCDESRDCFRGVATAPLRRGAPRKVHRPLQGPDGLCRW